MGLRMKRTDAHSRTQVYCAFMYAGSKHTAAGNMAAHFHATLTAEREERAKEAAAAARRLAEVQAELKQEREAKDHHVQVR